MHRRVQARGSCPFPVSALRSRGTATRGSEWRCQVESPCLALKAIHLLPTFKREISSLPDTVGDDSALGPGPRGRPGRLLILAESSLSSLATAPKMGFSLLSFMTAWILKTLFIFKYRISETCRDRVPFAQCPPGASI